ncbi:MAG TPA: efflux RND transporter permease subunit, partial [Gemmata sp.]|nr:efflux RND transporter permease subunit [Gemmata sp.]
TAGGIYSASRMASGVYPEVTFPRIAVVARVPDWDVTQMEVKVTRPLEDAVSGVLGVSFVRSKSIRGGSEISIDFSPGTDMRRAETLIWNRIGSKRSELPPNVELTVEQMTPSVFPIISLVLIGGDSPAQLRDYAEYQLSHLIKTIPDVLYANVAGGDIREIEVIVRPDDLLAVGMSAADLADQIAQQSNLHPVGRTEGQPFAFQIIVNNQPETVRQIEEMVISARKDQPVRVRDVASVKVLHKDRGLSIGYDQRDAVVITVFRRLGGNTLNISRDLQALLDHNNLTLPAGAEGKRPPRNIQAIVVYDQSQFVTTAVHNVRDAIVVGGLFSVLILLAFLRSWRATLISALAIPTTLAITFLFLHWSGETLNLMSLGGLAVAIGLIIDDTVVVVENIARHLSPARSELKQQPVAVTPAASTAGVDKSTESKSVPAEKTPGEADAIDKASGEITGAVLGSTLTTVLVFLPLAFIVGVYGQFFAALSWSLSIAVLVSMVISLTLVPVVAAKFLMGRPMPAPGRFYRFFERFYERGLTLALRFPWATLALSFLGVALGALLVTGVPDQSTPREEGKPPPPPFVKGLETGLMPSMDEGAFVVDYRAPSGTPLEETEKMARDIEKILAKNPDVQAYVRRTGAELGLFATQTCRGDIQVVLRPADDDPISLVSKRVRPPQEDLEKELKTRGQKLEDRATLDEVRRKYRRRPLTKIMEEIEDQIKDQYAEHQLKVELVQIMADELSDLSGANKPIEVKLFGPDQPVLRSIAEQVGELLEKKGKGRGIKEVNTNVFAGNPDLIVQLDTSKVERHGLKPDTVARQLRAMFLGQIAARAPESSLRITDVRVRYPDSFRFGPGRFDADFVRRQLIILPAGPSVPAGQSTGLAGPARAVPLSEMATVTPVRSPDQVYREGQQPAIFVTAELNEEEAGLGSVVADVRNWMSEVRLPAGYRWELGGHYLRQQEAFNSLLVVMVVAAVLVFIMLAFQFRSVTLPILIFLTQPLSLVSGLLALWLTNTPLNVSSYMGAILLIGLDMKNGIILVEYIQQLCAEGMELRPAIIEAGRTRFRPILMTSLAAILGLAPLAFGIGPGSQMQQPLAIMVIGGLTANMLFTRMIIPVGYLVLERTRRKRTAVQPASKSPPPPAPSPLRNPGPLALTPALLSPPEPPTPKALPQTPPSPSTREPEPVGLKQPPPPPPETPSPEKTSEVGPPPNPSPPPPSNP